MNAPYAKGKERPEKEAAIPDLQVTGLTSKGTYLGGLSWETAGQVDLCICSSDSLKFIQRPYWGSVKYIRTGFNNTLLSEVCILGTTSAMMDRWTYFPRTVKGDESSHCLGLPHGSRPLDDLFQQGVLRPKSLRLGLLSIY